MGIEFTDDGKQKWQSVTASLTISWDNGSWIEQCHAEAYGRNEVEAKANLIGSLKSLHASVAEEIQKLI